MSQLNFFLTQDEIASKIEAIIALDSFAMFNGKVFTTSTPEPITDVIQTKGFQSLILWVKNGSKIPLASIKGTGALAGNFLFDYLKDPIIEIENCRYVNGLFTPGRIYFKAGWIEDEVLRSMHQRAGDKLLKLFEANSSKVQKVWRVSLEVKKLVMQGSELELGSNGFRIDKSNIDAA
jgi:hypothetical protein